MEGAMKMDAGLAARLRRVATECGYVHKTGLNEGVGQGYRFAEAEKVLEKVNAACTRHGVVPASNTVEVLDKKVTERPPKSFNGKETPQKPLVCADVRVSFMLADVETGALSGPFQGVGSGEDSSDKYLSKATTMAHKYAYTLAFQIAYGTDPEAVDEDNKPTRRMDPPAAVAEAPAKAKGPAKRAPKPPPPENFAVTSLRAVIDTMTPDTVSEVIASLQSAKDLSERDYESLRDHFRSVRKERGIELPAAATAA